MAEELLDQIRDLVDGQIDFKGQQFAELLTTVVLSAVGFTAFIIGFLLQDIALALKVGLGGTALAFLIIVPPWPFFNKNPVTWLPVGGGAAVATSQQNIVIDEKMFAQH